MTPLTALLAYTLLCCTTAHADPVNLSAPQCALMQEKGVFTADNPVPCSRLVQVCFSYLDFHGRRHDDGRLVVLDVVAPQVQRLFAALLAHRFPLQKAQPLEAYGGDDEASMQDNNTSAFNGRAMTGGTAWSKHAYGVAIDFNPVQNPYLGKGADQHAVVLPPSARAYLRRDRSRPGMVEPVLEIFSRHGFVIWGGDWKQPVDYQHVEIGSRAFIAHLLALALPAAQAEFSAYADASAFCLARSRIADATQRRQTCARQTRR